MKVLHVLSRLNRSGMERMLECSYEHWTDAGVDPIIVGMADGAHPYAHALESRGYRVLETPPVRSARGLIGFRRVLQATRPEIVHIHQESCLDAVALLSASTRGVVGIVQTVHSCFRFNGNLRIRRKLRTRFSRHLGAVWVACGEEVAETERSLFGNHPVVVENWVDVAAIKSCSSEYSGRRVRTGLGIAAGAPVLGIIGNCGDPKNHELIAQALRHVARPVHVLHVGDATEMPSAEAAGWPVVPQRHTVHHLGARDDIPELLAACDLALFPSRYEGLPLVPIEALCAGVPVLAADVLTLRWLSSFPAVVLVDLDPLTWAVAIGRALSRNWAVDIEHSTRAVRARFNANRGVREYTSIYEEILRGRTSRRHSRGSRRREMPVVSTD